MKVVVISDTHSREKKLEWFENIPDDVNTVIHCGDFSHSENTFWSLLLSVRICHYHSVGALFFAHEEEKSKHT